MTYKWMKVTGKMPGSLLALAGLFFAGGRTATADMLTFCGITAPQGVHQIVAACAVPGGTIAGTATEIDLPSFHAIILSPLTLTGSGQMVFTATYQNFIGPGIDRVTLDGVLSIPPIPPFFTIGGETIFESGQGTTFNNNPAVVSGMNPAPVLGPVVPFFFTQTKEGDYSGAGTHIVGLQWNLPGIEQFILPGSVEGDLQVSPEPSTLLLLGTASLGLLGWRRRQRRA